jgi:hypothetical protein
VAKESFVVYKNTIVSRIDLNTLSPSSGVEVETLIDHITTVLTQAANLAIPRAKTTTHATKRFPPEAVKIHKQLKHTFWLWKQDGRNPNDPLQAEIKQLKKSLRQAQRRAASREKQDLYQAISEATYRDTKLFHRLIN